MVASAFWRIGVHCRICTVKSPEKLYRFHVENLRAVDAGLERVARSIRDAIGRSDSHTVYAFVRVYALLLGAWAECRLRKLLYEPSGFTNQQRTAIVSKQTQLDQWQAALEKAFRKQYNVKRALLSTNNLTFTAYSRYVALSEMLANDLRHIVELRNKLAHGQWAYPLNDDGNDVAQEQMDALRGETLLSLQLKKNLILRLSEIIHDLVVSEPTFQRDFDGHYRAVVETRRHLEKRSYDSYVNGIRVRWEKGRQRRAPAGGLGSRAV